MDAMADDLVPPAEFRILLALVDGPKHGHGIRAEVLERTDGRVDLGPGTLYGAIKRLDRRGWIEETAPPRGEGHMGDVKMAVLGVGAQAGGHDAGPDISLIVFMQIICFLMSPKQM